jgi:capsid protein
LESFNAYAVFRDSAAEGLSGMVLGDPAENTESEQKQVIETIENGTVLHLNKGDEVRNLKPETPGATYTPYMETKMQELCAGVGIPREFLMNSWQGLSWSSSKALWIAGHSKINEIKNWLSKYVKRIVIWKIAKSIKEGILPPVINEQGESEHWKLDIIIPKIESLDRSKEADADTKEFVLGKVSLFEICKREGKDLEEVLTQKANDIIFAKKLANKINEAEKDGFKVNWTDLIGMGKQLTGNEVQAKIEDNNMTGENNESI